MRALCRSCVFSLCLLTASPGISADINACNWTKKGLQINGNQLNCDFVPKSGHKRSYMIHLPPNLDPEKGLVFMYHGAHQNQYFFGNTGWFRVSDENGFAFVGAVNDPCETGWGSPCADDEQYSVELIDSAIANLKINPRRVFITGFSAGAVFTHVFVSRHADLVAAAAAYEGAYVGKPENPYYQPPNGPVSVLIINGTDSRGEPYCDTRSGWWGTDRVFGYWAHSAALACHEVTPGGLCSGGPAFGQLQRPSDVTFKRATGCKDETEVIFYGLKGGIHRYYNQTVELTNPPGTKLAPYNAHFNRSTGTYLAEIIWNFFVAHPKPADKTATL